jgi:sugar transferase (PEP-CTERM system associated)
MIECPPPQSITMIRIYRHFVPTATVCFIVGEAALIFMLAQSVIGLGAGEVEEYLHVAYVNNVAMSFFLVATTILSGLAAGLYRRDFGAGFGWVWTAATAIGLALGLGIPVIAIFGLVGGAHAVTLGHWEFALPLICAAGFVMVRRAGIAVVRQGLFKRRIVLVGDGARAAEVSASADASGSTVRIVQRLHFDGARGMPQELRDEWSPSRLRAEGIREAVIAVEDVRGLPMDLLLQWKLNGISVTDYATFWEREVGCISLDAFDPNWFVYGEGCSRGQLGRTIKRLLDIVVSLGLLVASAPLMCGVALLIRWETPGPVLYRQQRVGKSGEPFTLLKFRSMSVEAETGAPKWAQQNDPRVTRIGKFIRRTRIDELPQLVNVILGHMSLIGPRPERPFFVEELCRQIPYYAERHVVRPGLTGWAQINYPYGASIDDARRKLEYDLYYLKNQSILLDLYIMISTVRVILFREGSR